MKDSIRRRWLLASPVIVAALLAAALVGVSFVAADSLRARDAAVRDGLLARTGHELEGVLRESGYPDASAALARFASGQGPVVRGIAVASAAGTLVRWGATDGAPFEMPAMLGPGWRGLGGPGTGPMRGGRSPFSLRLYPAPGTGRAGRLAALLVTGALLAAAGLVASSVFAARGLAERERSQRLESERERLDALALAGAGLAHRVRNPLAAIKGTAQLIAAQPQAPAGERAARIVEASVRIETLVSQLLRFARPPEPRAEPFDLASLAREAAARTPGAASVSAEVPVPVRADAGHVADILDELLANARTHDPDGALEIAVGIGPREASVEVRDRGAGLSVDPEELFAPFVTTRPGGTGLGLPTIRVLAHANGGEVRLAAREGGGCVARLTLPRVEA